jgi:hypothetical protein
MPIVRSLFDKGLKADCIRFAGRVVNRVYSLLLATKLQEFTLIIDSGEVTFGRALYETSCWECKQIHYMKR